MIGLDIYDCVCVLNTQSAVDAFARRARVSLGGELAVVAGPVGAGGGLETAFGGKSAPKKENTGNAGLQAGTRPKSSGACDNKPVWSYMKSRGFYAGVQADGTVIVPRQDANAAFYGEREISVERILKGQVNSSAKGKESKDLVMWPEGGRQLSEVLKAAEGKGGDDNVIRNMGDGPTPGDLATPSDGTGTYQGSGTGTGSAGISATYTQASR
jgi:lipid-binding SYLF domain-containing protein